MINAGIQKEPVDINGKQNKKELKFKKKISSMIKSYLFLVGSSKWSEVGTH